MDEIMLMLQVSRSNLTDVPRYGETCQIGELFKWSNTYAIKIKILSRNEQRDI